MTKSIPVPCHSIYISPRFFRIEFYRAAARAITLALFMHSLRASLYSESLSIGILFVHLSYSIESTLGSIACLSPYIPAIINNAVMTIDAMMCDGVIVYFCASFQALSRHWSGVIFVDAAVIKHSRLSLSNTIRSTFGLVDSGWGLTTTSGRDGIEAAEAGATGIVGVEAGCDTSTAGLGAGGISSPLQATKIKAMVMPTI